MGVRKQGNTVTDASIPRPPNTTVTCTPSLRLRSRRGRRSQPSTEAYRSAIERVASDRLPVRDALGVQPLEVTPLEKPAWRRAFEMFVRTLTEHLQERGVGRSGRELHHRRAGNHGGERVDIHENTAKLYHSVDPNIQMFANPAGGATDSHIDRLLAYSTILDPIWQYPGEYAHVRHIVETAPIVWTYACGEGAKDRRRMEYYWAPIWRGAQLGITGIGFLSYAGRTIDMWQGPVSYGCDWEMGSGRRTVVRPPVAGSALHRGPDAAELLTKPRTHEVDVIDYVRRIGVVPTSVSSRGRQRHAKVSRLQVREKCAECVGEISEDEPITQSSIGAGHVPGTRERTQFDPYVGIADRAITSRDDRRRARITVKRQFRTAEDLAKVPKSRTSQSTVRSTISTCYSLP